MPEIPRDKIVTIEVKFRVSGARWSSDAVRVIENRIYPDIVPFDEDGMKIDHGRITNLSAEEVGLDGRPFL